jgi:hypothetical protein
VTYPRSKAKVSTEDTYTLLFDTAYGSWGRTSRCEDSCSRTLLANAEIAHGRFSLRHSHLTLDVPPTWRLYVDKGRARCHIRHTSQLLKQQLVSILPDASKPPVLHIYEASRGCYLLHPLITFRPTPFCSVVCDVFMLSRTGGTQSCSPPEASRSRRSLRAPSCTSQRSPSSRTGLSKGKKTNLSDIFKRVGWVYDYRTHRGRSGRHRSGSPTTAPCSTAARRRSSSGQAFRRTPRNHCTTSHA